jgi:hypothetical protein
MKNKPHANEQHHIMPGASPFGKLPKPSQKLVKRSRRNRTRNARLAACIIRVTAHDVHFAFVGLTFLHLHLHSPTQSTPLVTNGILE